MPPSRAGPPSRLSNWYPARVQIWAGGTKNPGFSTASGRPTGHRAEERIPAQQLARSSKQQDFQFSSRRQRLALLGHRRQVVRRRLGAGNVRGGQGLGFDGHARILGRRGGCFISRGEKGGAGRTGRISQLRVSEPVNPSFRAGTLLSRGGVLIANPEHRVGSRLTARLGIRGGDRTRRCGLASLAGEIPHPDPEFSGGGPRFRRDCGPVGFLTGRRPRLLLTGRRRRGRTSRMA
jgi:hypothetical protein